ncbi:MAG: LysM peptidoglycan-binding domain-containing M23 family metallopeptidase [Chloroflexota bacterium]
MRPFVKRAVFITLIPIILSFPATTFAQGGETTYIIQAGDSLSKIANKYDISLSRLADRNDIDNPNLIFVGQKIAIPQENVLSNASSDAVSSSSQAYTIQPGDTLFTIANQFEISLSSLAEANSINNVDIIRIGQVLLIPSTTVAGEEETLLAPFESITVSAPRIRQGKTLSIEVALSEAASLTASFDERPIYVYNAGDRFLGVVGIHALQETGLYPITFQATLDDGRQVTTTKNIIVIDGGYSTEHIEVSGELQSLLTPEVIRAEFNMLSSLWTQASTSPYWEQPFGYPIDNVRFTSYFGTRRSYNAGPVSSYHSGTDFGGAIGTPLYAPAPGKVVLAEALDVRGNAVLIDHGLGVYSGYWHQSDIAVSVGETVWQGQVIGYLGQTGLVTGPHLHWELRIGGIAVDATQWVQEAIP